MELHEKITPPPHEEGQFVKEAVEAQDQVKNNRLSHPCCSYTNTAIGIIFPGNVIPRQPKNVRTCNFLQCIQILTQVKVPWLLSGMHNETYL